MYGISHLSKVLLTYLIKAPAKGTGNELSFSTHCLRMVGGISQKMSWVGTEEP